MQKNFRAPVPCFLVFFTIIFLFHAPIPLAGADEGTPEAVHDAIAASSEDPENCREVMALLKEHEARLTRELRTIKREIAALNQAVEEPGVRDAVAGIGYILGLFGIAAFMASRRKNRNPEK